MIMTLELAYINPEHNTPLGKDDFKIPPPMERVVDSEAHDIQAHKPISVYKLYGDREALRPEFRMALQLLSEARGRVDAASESIRNGAQIAADDSMQYLQAIVHELFCLRDIGEGYACIVNALISAFENLGQSPANEVQIRAIQHAIYGIEDAPFMSIEASLSLISKLDEAGFVTEPTEMKYLSDLLDDQSIR
jgi:hypothetical protein